MYCVVKHKLFLRHVIKVFIESRYNWKWLVCFLVSVSGELSVREVSEATCFVYRFERDRVVVAWHQVPQLYLRR